MFFLHLSLHHVHAHRGHRKALSPVELQLQMAVSLHVGARNETWGPLQEP